MFYTVYCHDGISRVRDSYVVLRRATTLIEIAKLRVASGDLVVDDKGDVVQDISWLWDWEVERESYAFRCVVDMVSMRNFPHGACRDWSSERDFINAAQNR